MAAHCRRVSGRAIDGTIKMPRKGRRRHEQSHDQCLRRSSEPSVSSIFAAPKFKKVITLFPICKLHSNLFTSQHCIYGVHPVFRSNSKEVKLVYNMDTIGSLKNHKFEYFTRVKSIWETE